MAVKWVVKDGTELNAQELYDLLQLRVEVFTVEQNCPYQDLDRKDLHDWVYHVQGFPDTENSVGAYLRIMYNRETPTEAQIGRVVVRQTQRCTGMGRQLMTKALEIIDSLQPTRPVKTIMLHGQAHLRKWYESFGFETSGEPFDEDGIPHLLLIKRL